MSHWLQDESSQNAIEYKIIYACIVAGKSATFADQKTESLLAPAARHDKTPIEFLNDLIHAELLGDRLRSVGTGNYGKLKKCFFELVRQVFDMGVDLTKVTPDELETIHGIGQKTSRFFILWTRPDAEVAALDTHILKWLRSRGYDAPKSTPSSKKIYAELESAFIEEAKQIDVTPRELDWAIWKSYSGRGDDLLDEYMK